MMVSPKLAIGSLEVASVKFNDVRIEDDNGDRTQRHIEYKIFSGTLTVVNDGNLILAAPIDAALIDVLQIGDNRHLLIPAGHLRMQISNSFSSNVSLYGKQIPLPTSAIDVTNSNDISVVDGHTTGEVDLTIPAGIEVDPFPLRLAGVRIDARARALTPLRIAVDLTTGRARVTEGVFKGAGGRFPTTDALTLTDAHITLQASPIATDFSSVVVDCGARLGRLSDLGWHNTTVKFDGNTSLVAIAAHYDDTIALCGTAEVLLRRDTAPTLDVVEDIGGLIDKLNAAHESRLLLTTDRLFAVDAQSLRDFYIGLNTAALSGGECRTFTLTDSDATLTIRCLAKSVAGVPVSVKLPNQSYAAVLEKLLQLCRTPVLSDEYPIIDAGLDPRLGVPFRWRIDHISSENVAILGQLSATPSAGEVLP
jgi:hypothetical protein